MCLKEGGRKVLPLDEKLRTVYDRKTNAYQIFTYWRLLMSVIPKITCRRCGREYSGLRSRCPYCGTGRSRSAERIPLRTSSENAGTPAAEHAAVNTKWQMLFGGILLIAVVAAVIVLITVSLNASKNGSASAAPTPPATVSSAAPVTTPTPTPEPTRRRHRHRRSRALPSRSSAASARSLRPKLAMKCRSERRFIRPAATRPSRGRVRMNPSPPSATRVS